MNIGIVGYGFVGKALDFGFNSSHSVLVHDKYQEGTLPLKEVLESSEVIFFCLPTPFHEDTLHIDLSIYDEVIKEASQLVSGKIFVIKSTVVPGTTQKYSELYPNNEYVFNPEFLTEVNANEDFVNASRIVVGGSGQALMNVVYLYRECSHFKYTRVLTMTPTEAEIVKYQANVTLATRVAISNYFYDICEELGADYSRVREGVILDDRIGPSHNTVTEERGFGGKCFIKDLAAIIGKGDDLGIDTSLPKEIFNYNLRIRKVEDWKDIPFVAS